jgi:hypothetical protein
VGGRKHLIFVAQLPGVQALLVQEKVIRSACNSERKPSKQWLSPLVWRRPALERIRMVQSVFRPLCAASLVCDQPTGVIPVLA